MSAVTPGKLRVVLDTNVYFSAFTHAADLLTFSVRWGREAASYSYRSATIGSTLVARRAGK